ncbi:hypothetical protein NHX12_000895 [Muraenolepis orangiensis]|uniref:Protein kinase domain-containing protein n=1 Tax=Muraenolepis orangiensis TaxID=630683 RepID=A0A9Q0DYZ6_9TELE|nr:hypothetical protein NHX12_000895 [Muraenolepis orangiensis]
MEEEEHTDRKQQLAMLHRMLDKMKRNLNEELKAIQDVNEAEANFLVARSHSQDFAFVHIAYANFEHTQGNTRKAQPDVSPESQCWRDQSTAHSATTILHRQDGGDLFKVEDTSRIVNSNSPESCRDFLLNLEKSGDPHTDCTLLTKLKDCYAKVFSRLPIEQYTKNESYAKILVRYAELKGIEDSDEAQDHFIVARSNYKCFAFVHIAHAQFEVSQGNIKKATSIILKAQKLKAKPPRLLAVALQNLQAGEKILLSAEEEAEEETHRPDGVQLQNKDLPPACGSSQECLSFGRVATKPPVDQPQPASKEPLSAWKMRSVVNRHVSPQEKPISPTEPRPYPRLLDSIPTPAHPVPARINLPIVCQTPNNKREPYANSFVTPSVRKHPPPSSQKAAVTQAPCTPVNQASHSHTPQSALLALSNESITIKGKQFFILKMIGRGGSSKVYQVLDQKKQLYAVKYVDLEEADPQTVEGYKNEIEHLNRLQQHSDQIIKLYDYEITDRCIYMLMECGNLDLNTWLRNRKTVIPLERKLYWKNMLEAVHTIHKHGIVHSDLKPANFVIVNASLKLIDFGIANRIQPDVTSIMKDSQVGTLNYMPPEAIYGTSSQSGKASSKISPKGDVWSLGCILYCMTYGRTPFQSITNQIAKLHAIVDPSYKIEFPDIAEGDLLDVLKKCLLRNPRERISIAELLDHSYLQLQPQSLPEPECTTNNDLRRILTDLAALNSPNSIVRAANNLAKMCNSGRQLDVADCVKKTSQLSWKM